MKRALTNLLHHVKILSQRILLNYWMLYNFFEFKQCPFKSKKKSQDFDLETPSIICRVSIHSQKKRLQGFCIASDKQVSE